MSSSWEHTWEPLEQTLIPSTSPRIYIQRFSSRHAEQAAALISQLNRQVLGISVQLSTKGRVEAVVFATGSSVYHVECDSYPSKAISNVQQRTEMMMESLLDGRYGTLTGFGMARLALHIHRDLGIDCQGIDLPTLLARSRSRPYSPSECITRKINPDVNRHRVDQLWYGGSQNREENACLRAWLSARVAEYSIPETYGSPTVCTRTLEIQHLECLGRMILIIELSNATKPTSLENEFDWVEMADGQLILQNSRFKTRVRRSNQTSVHMETSQGENMIGRAVHAHGKQTNIHLLRGTFRGSVERVRVIGREEASLPELARDEFLLRLLQDEITLRDHYFIDLLWFTTQAPRFTAPPLDNVLASPAFTGLNHSQCTVAAAMISSTQPLVIAHGPPGTGKTTTIATAVKHWSSTRQPVWIVARSNVAVRNIARSLLSNEVSDFKLLVSKEFYLEWHEDIYTRVETHLIRSDDLFNDPVTAERRFGGSHIVLCTLSMLSNHALDELGIFDLIPVERLVVDEASQIDTFDFMHLFQKFRKLRKVCFFGDPEQLPPFGQENAPFMRSIFEISHLQPIAYFLNTQYRMPIPLGDFISHEVYNSTIQSEHYLRDMSCVSFVDVAKGKEEKCGHSWMNTEEVHTVIHLVRQYYRNRDFCIITPYDAQRAAIQKKLQAEHLPHDRVFNVDSFQGHEAAYVIVSAVRTTAPGFLRHQTRMNVMLTRCEAGMVIVTNRRFVHMGARTTLLGKLAKHWEQNIGMDATWKDSRLVADLKADMPGVAASQHGSTSNVNAQGPRTTRPVSSVDVCGGPSPMNVDRAPSPPPMSHYRSTVESTHQHAYSDVVKTSQEAAFHFAETSRPFNNRSNPLTSRHSSNISGGYHHGRSAHFGSKENSETHSRSDYRRHRRSNSDDMQVDHS